MKIIHTADLHLGNVFHQHTRTEEHQHFLDWLRQTLRSEAADALIISGDIFDNHNPSAEAQRMFYDFLHQAEEENEGLQIVIIAGNHDAGARLEAATELLRRHNIYVRGTLQRDAQGQVDLAQHLLPLARRGEQEAAVVCFALPYLRSADLPTGMQQGAALQHYFTTMEQVLKTSDFRGLPIVAMAHCYTAGAEVALLEHSERLVVGGEDVVDDGIIPRHFAYTALGHLHKAQSVNDRDNVRYAGSPIALSFSERGYQRSVVSITIEPNASTRVGIIAYKPLVALLSVPERGAGEVEEVLQALRRLPDRAAHPLPETWPYLEVNLKLRQPEPELRHKLLDIVKDKAVRFCRATTSAKRAPNATLRQLPTLDGELQRLTPLDIAQQFYQERYDQPMPKALTERFRKAEEATHQ